MSDLFPTFSGEKSAPLYAAANSHVVPSAVLALFLQNSMDQGRYDLVLTRRSHSVKTHKGQISLPGGRREAGDASPAATALRETHEELGIEPAHITVHGHASPIRGLDGSEIYPVVGSCDIDAQLITPSASEVAEVLFVPWQKLTRNKAVRANFVMFGKTRETWVFDGGVCKIWGLTAQILFDLNLRG
ncbi:MAG: CoA pyrophosphatase [Oligoflexales bacterium]